MTIEKSGIINSQIRGSSKVSLKPCSAPSLVSLTWSAASRAAMISFSSTLSQFALAGPSGNPQSDDAAQQRRNAFQDQHPLPAMQAVTADSQQKARNRSTDHHRQRHPAQEQRDKARPRRGWKPVGHVQHHAGIKPGLGGTQKKAHDGKTDRVFHKGLRHG